MMKGYIEDSEMPSTQEPRYLSSKEALGKSSKGIMVENFRLFN